ncbi:ABC-2 type transport system permease protein [Marinactinospora thermotolerans DSM 45154]|uniref:Transport permease protein n=1 Tax=Marinactinospora thermotolerans DSM 45154 TaxID=1122192 RepID=A0A1T4P3I5_9ACTN|nr:ABC transporter permease [Marinactinospora thermotolerans]SJZ86180.1 ABC-2 type transport system permease protein [Marinactinospora thermotolerans DSM 45154]
MTVETASMRRGARTRPVKGLLRDTLVSFRREMTPALREPGGVLLGTIIAMLQPLLFLVLFGPVLAGGGGREQTWQWFIPGVLVMMCLFGPLSAGYSLLSELIGGAMERMLVTPASRTAMLMGRTLKGSLILLVQAVLIVAVAIPMGLRPDLVGVIVGIALLVVFGTGLGALSFVLAILSRPSGTLFYLVTQTVVFPLMLLSGVLLPLEAAPGWLRAVAALNPVTYVVEAQRRLFVGELAAPPVLYGAVVAVAVAAVGLLLATRAMRRAV